MAGEEAEAGGWRLEAGGRRTSVLGPRSSARTLRLHIDSAPCKRSGTEHEARAALPTAHSLQPTASCIRSRGFTLIEVLAALVIVSLGMLGVIQAVSQTVSNSGYLRDKTLAHWVAMNRVTEARLQSSAPPVEETSGEVDMAGQRWRWTMNVAKTAVENVRRIDVKVARAEADKKSSLASITGFFGATVAPPGTALIVWDASPATAPGTTTPGGTVPGGLTIGSTPTPTPTPKP